MPWQLSGNGRSGWSTKLIRGLKAEAAAGFQSRRERCREPTPVNPHYAAFATYKAARVHTLISGSAAASTTVGPRAAAGNSGRRRDERPRTGRVQASIPSRRRQMCSDPPLSKQPRIYSITRYRVASSTCRSCANQSNVVAGAFCSLHRDAQARGATSCNFLVAQ